MDAWRLYDELIEGIPQDVLVLDYCLGIGWSYVEAESAVGVSYTCRGGACKRTDNRNFQGLPLREMAKLAKSWNFEEASLGVAAMNAWYSRTPLLDALGARYDEPIELPDGSLRKVDAFEIMRPQIAAKEDAHVVVVGHFPHVDRISEYARLTVLERQCRGDLDTPDPACEFVMPQADYAFITGVTLENKTAPRLLRLSKHAFTTMVGPSAVMAGALFCAGVDMIAGSVVADPELAKHAVKTSAGMFFGKALQMTTVIAPGAGAAASVTNAPR